MTWAARELIKQAHGHITKRLTLVRCRVTELAKLEQELSERQTRCEQKLASLDDQHLRLMIAALHLRRRSNATSLRPLSHLVWQAVRVVAV